MTPTEVALKEKESAILQSFSGIFPSIDTFYATCYLIIRNGHQWEQEKSDMWEEKCETVAWFRHKMSDFCRCHLNICFKKTAQI